MRVLHLSSERTWRGGEQQIAYLIEELQKRQVECFVACREGSAFESYCLERKISFIVLPFKGSFDIKTALGVKNYCSEKKIDLVHLHTSNAHSIGVLSSLFGNKRPFVLTRRVDFNLKKSFLSRWKYNHKQIKKIICISETIKQMVSPNIIDSSKCITVHSGIDIKKFNGVIHNSFLRKRYNLHEGELIVGNVAAIAPHKDLYTFIDTARLLVEKGFKAKYFLVGDGPLNTETKTYIIEKGLENHVFMTGFLKNIPEILKELDIFLFTSKTEGLGTIILDAFAAGAPVISTKAGGIPEIVIDRETGLLAEVGDANALAERVIELANNEQLKNKITLNAREKVSHFSKENTALKNLEVYKQILKD